MLFSLTLQIIQGSVILSGQQALSAISDNALCTTYFVVIVSGAVFLVALPRTLDRLSALGLVSTILILFAGLVAMVGASLNPIEGRTLSIAGGTDFYSAFVAVTNPVCTFHKVSLKIL